MEYNNMTKSNTARKVDAPIVSVDGLVHIGKATFSRTDAVNVIVDNLNAMSQDQETIGNMGQTNIDRIITNGKYDLAIEASFDTTANYKKWKRQAKDLPQIYVLANQRLSEMRNIAANARIAKRLVKDNPELGNFGSQKILNTCKKDEKFKSINAKRKSPIKKATPKAAKKFTEVSIAKATLALVKEHNLDIQKLIELLTTK